MIGADRTLSGVMGEMPHLCPLVQGDYSIFTEGPVTHGGDIQEACGIRLYTVFSSNLHPDFIQIQMLWAEGVIHPFVACRINVTYGSEWDRVPDILGTLVNHTPLLPVERGAAGIGLDEILTNFWTDELQEITHMTNHRKIPQYRMTGLGHVHQSYQNQRPHQDQRPKDWRPDQINQTVKGQNQKTGSNE